MKKVKMIYLVIALVFMFSFAGCGKTDQEKIVGTWEVVKVDGEETEIDNSITFSEEGSVVLISDSRTEQMGYEVADGKIIFNLDYGYLYVYDYELKGNRLTIFDFGLYAFDTSDFEFKKK